MDTDDSDATFCSDASNGEQDQFINTSISDELDNVKDDHGFYSETISDLTHSTSSARRYHTSTDSTSRKDDFANETISSLVFDRDTPHCSKVKKNSDIMAEEEDSFASAWKVGDHCRAPYAGDDLIYDAIIKAIIDDDDNKDEQLAEVIFIDYESDGSEMVPISKLMRSGKSRKRKFHPSKVKKESTSSSATRLFKHLDAKSYQVESNNDASSLFKDLVQSSSLVDPLNQVISNVSKPKRLKRLKGDDEYQTHLEELRHVVSESSSNAKHSTPANSSSHAVKKINPQAELLKLNFDADGFDDDDYERPRFKDAHAGPAITYRLSGATEATTIQIPANINRYLREYQREGIQFLYNNYKANRGSILGDDMGLGKTVQIIGFIAAVLNKSGTKEDVMKKLWWKSSPSPTNKRQSFLIVSPGSVLYNWIDELNTWGHFKVGRFHASHKDETLQQLEKGRLDVVLTTFETLRNYLDDLNSFKWLAVIVDEAHRLKDGKSKVTIAMKNIKCRRRIGLTGTAMQNRLSEFWCLLDWANPGCLGTLGTFQKDYESPIKQGRKFNVTKRELANSNLKSEELTKLHSQWFLRRTKALIAEQLPKKDEKVVFCYLSELQNNLYEELLKNSDVDLIVRQSEPCDCGSKKNRGKCCYQTNIKGEKINSLLMQYLQLFLKVANHVALLLPNSNQSEEQRNKAREICVRMYSNFPQFKSISSNASLLTLSDPLYCGKMKALEALLIKFKKDGSKVLLFSYSVQLLNILETYIMCKGINYCRLDGNTRIEQRADIVRKFNNDPQISLCLISTKAGSLGLNFTGANSVLIFDPNWNPAHDLQAQDRAYRIGQRCDVRVYRLITSGTIEEVMYLRQIYKLQLANVAMQNSKERRYFTGVADDKEQHGELFGIENLFSLRRRGVSLAEDIIKRTQQVEAGLRMAKYESRSNEKENTEEQIKTSEKEQNMDTKKFDDDDVPGLEEIASQYVEPEIENTTTSNAVEGKQSKNNQTDQEKYTLNKNNNRNWPESSDQADSVDSLKDLGLSVEYCHSNKKVIGSSKAEQRMTSNAIRDVYVKHQFSQQPANLLDPGEESDDLGDSQKDKKKKFEDCNKEADPVPSTSKTKAHQITKCSKNNVKYDSVQTESEENLQEKQETAVESDRKSSRKQKAKQFLENVDQEMDTHVIIGSTPIAIRKKQFSEMAQFFQFDDDISFAKAVLKYTDEKRENILSEFYTTLDNKIQQL